MITAKKAHEASSKVPTAWHGISKSAIRFALNKIDKYINDSINLGDFTAKIYFDDIVSNPDNCSMYDLAKAVKTELEKNGYKVNVVENEIYMMGSKYKVPTYFEAAW